MKKELADTIEHANRKLVNITRGGFPVNFADVEIKAEESDLGLITIISGVTQIAYAGENGFVDLKKAIWRVVDQTRKQVEALTGPTGIDTREPEQKVRIPEINRIKDVISEVEGFVARANHTLEEIVSGGFPFSLADVVMSVDVDDVGIYVRSGDTPICAVPRIRDLQRAVDTLELAISDAVDDIRAAVERRGGLQEEFKALVAKSEELDKAILAGCNPAILGIGIDKASADAVRHAAEKAIEKANQRVRRLYYGKALDIVGRGDWHATKLKLKGFSGGLVVIADGVPCMVTHYPRIVTNKTVADMAVHITSNIMAITDERCRYFRRVLNALNHEKAIHKGIEKYEDADNYLASLAM